MEYIRRSAAHYYGDDTYIHALGLCLGTHDDTGCLEFAFLLENRQPTGFLKLTFASLALGLLALRIRQTSARLGQHLLLYINQ